MNQSIFDIIYGKYKIKKQIRLIELFAGYGSQALSLKYLNINFEHWKICEWAIKSIQAYKDCHFTNIDTNFNSNRTKQEMIDFLFNMGISQDYNMPMSKQQISRLSEKQLTTIIKNIGITHNLVNICNIKGSDLEIVDTDKYDYIMTYSFPCQDLSLAGKGKGMVEGSETRSEMIWEVGRILDECPNKPQILLMENVPQVIGSKNVSEFNKWQLKLESFGYKNYHQNLIATDYGIPQTRNRCFMISILGDYSYIFPQPIPLNLLLKDMLEENVDEKYYLSDKLIKCFQSNGTGNYPRGERFEQSLKKVNEQGLANTIITSEGNKATRNFLKIPEATKKGYAIAKDGDGVYINRPHQKRGVVQKDKIQTLKTMPDVGVVVGTYQYAKPDNFMNGKDRLQIGKETSDTIQTTPKEGVVYNNLRIRKLTPKECFRLMGVKDEDFENIARNQSDSSLYHLAGDSIVVNVLMAIFRELL